MSFQILREKLIGVVEFQYFEKGRVIIQEGHPAMAFYFIVNGEVQILKPKFDKDSKQFERKPLAILSSGEFFGHVGLIYNKPRNATIVSLSESTNKDLHASSVVC
jgi:CRP-like cAMP-binding protein